MQQFLQKATTLCSTLSFLAFFLASPVVGREVLGGSSNFTVNAENPSVSTKVVKINGKVIEKPVEPPPLKYSYDFKNLVPYYKEDTEDRLNKLGTHIHDFNVMNLTLLFQKEITEVFGMYADFPYHGEELNYLRLAYGNFNKFFIVSDFEKYFPQIYAKVSYNQNKFFDLVDAKYDSYDFSLPSIPPYDPQSKDPQVYKLMKDATYGVYSYELRAMKDVFIKLGEEFPALVKNKNLLEEGFVYYDKFLKTFLDREVVCAVRPTLKEQDSCLDLVGFIFGVFPINILLPYVYTFELERIAQLPSKEERELKLKKLNNASFRDVFGIINNLKYYGKDLMPNRASYLSKNSNKH